MNSELWAFHVSTGYPVMEAKKLLAEMAPLLRERIMLAITQRPPDERILKDPLELDPLFSETIQAARLEAERIAAGSGISGRGSGHFIAATQSKILLDRHGIVWFPHYQMNPWVIFD